MKFVRIFAGSLIIALLFSATSCVYIDNSLGSGFVPSDQMLDLRMETFDIPVEMAMADSLQSGYLSSMELGSIVTEEFGKFNAAMAVSFTPAVDSIDWGKNPKFIEMSVSLTAETSFCPSTDQDGIPQNINFYQLNVELDSTKVYPNSIGEKDYNHKPINKGNVVYMGDGVIQAYFTEEFGKKLFDFTMAQLDSTEYFMKHFYGLYIKTDELEEGQTGGRLNSVDLSSSYVYLTYSYTTEEGKTSYKTATFVLGEEYSVGSYTASSQALATKDTQKEIFCEGLSGIKPVIRAKALKSVLENWSAQAGISLDKVLINRACIEFPFDYNGERTSLDNYPGTLFPCQRALNESIASYIYYQPLTEVDDALFEGGALNRSQMSYKSDIGLYLQDILKRSDLSAFDDLWMLPTKEATSSTTGDVYYTVDYSSYYVGKLNGTTSNRRPKLVLTYSLIK